jgi:hypothetical protein
MFRETGNLNIVKRDYSDRIVQPPGILIGWTKHWLIPRLATSVPYAVLALKLLDPRIEKRRVLTGQQV